MTAPEHTSLSRADRLLVEQAKAEFIVAAKDGFGRLSSAWWKYDYTEGALREALQDEYAAALRSSGALQG